MERIRPFLMITLIFLGLLLWQAWEDKYNSQIKSDPITQPNSYDNNVLPVEIVISMFLSHQLVQTKMFRRITTLMNQQN